MAAVAPSPAQDARAAAEARRRRVLSRGDERLSSITLRKAAEAPTAAAPDALASAHHSQHAAREADPAGACARLLGHARAARRVRCARRVRFGAARRRLAVRVVA
jgi:hypothetical protein